MGRYCGRSQENSPTFLGFKTQRLGKIRGNYSIQTFRDVLILLQPPGGTVELEVDFCEDKAPADLSDELEPKHL